LSGGEQQMLAIVRGLLSGPEILMIDELSLGLAPVVVHQLFMTLMGLKKAGLTILLVEQNVHLACCSADATKPINGVIDLPGGCRRVCHDNKKPTKQRLRTGSSFDEISRMRGTCWGHKPE
jgi:ABC-type branched-subunit amino acid transport system ATPase component